MTSPVEVPEDRKMDAMTRTINKPSTTPPKANPFLLDDLGGDSQIALPLQQTLSMPNLPLVDTRDADILLMETQMLMDSITTKCTQAMDQEPKAPALDLKKDSQFTVCTDIDTETATVQNKHSLTKTAKTVSNQTANKEGTSKSSEVNMNTKMDVLECSESAGKLKVKAPGTKKKKQRRKRPRHKKKGKKISSDQEVNCDEQPPSSSSSLEISCTEHCSVNLQNQKESVSTMDAVSEIKVVENEDEDQCLKESVDDMIREISMSPSLEIWETSASAETVVHWEGLADYMEDEEAATLKSIEEDIHQEIKKQLGSDGVVTDPLFLQCNSDEKHGDIAIEEGNGVASRDSRLCSPESRCIGGGYGIQQHQLHHPLIHGQSPKWSAHRSRTPPPAVSRVPMFNQMRVRDLMGYQLTIREIIDFNLFVRFMEDPYGSRYLSYLVDRMAVNEPAMHFLADFLSFGSIDFVVNVASTKFGNHFVQILFQKHMPSKHDALLKKWIYPFSLKLSGDVYGCRVIQRIINSNTVSMDHKKELVSSLGQAIAETEGGEQELHEMLISKNSNHVLQAVLNLGLPSESVEFIRIQLEKELVTYSDHMSACRVLQTYISSYGDRLNITPLLDNYYHIDLAQREYGNHVIQCILKQKAWYSSQTRFTEFRDRFFRDVFTWNNVLNLSKGKQGSHVLETCIRSADDEQIELLTKLCVNRKALLLKKMVWDQFGNYVLRSLFDRASDAMKKVIADTVHYYVLSLDRMTHSESERSSYFIYKVYWFRREQWKRTRY